MAKELLRDSGAAAMEKILQMLMPQLNARLDTIQQQLSEFRTHVDEKFERNQELMNELGLHINTVSSKLEVLR